MGWFDEDDYYRQMMGSTPPKVVKRDLIGAVYMYAFAEVVMHNKERYPEFFDVLRSRPFPG